MPDITALQLSMARGAVTPLAHARVDLDDYRRGLKTCQNWLPLKYGGVTRVPGTTDLNATGDSARTSRLFTYTFNRSQSYALEFFDQKIRFHTTSGYIATSEISSPYLEADLWGIQLEAIGDSIFIVCDGYAPRELVRNSDTSWTLSLYAFKRGPYLPTVQGCAIYTHIGQDSVIPDVLTTNTSSDYGHVSDHNGGANTYLQFDKDPATKHTRASSTSGWVEVDFAAPSLGVPLTVTGYSLRAPDDLDLASQSAPTHWVLEASSFGADWTILDERDGQPDWVPGETRAFEIANEEAYDYYRVRWMALISGVTTAVFAEIGLLRASDEVLANMSTSLLGPSLADVNDGDGMTANDVGRLLRALCDDGIYRDLKIAARTGASNISVLNLGPCPLVGFVQSGTARMATNIWQLGAWGAEPGYPRAVGKHKGRLGFAATDKQPTTAWFTVAQSYYDLGVSTPLVNDDALTLTLNSGSLDEILWMASNGDDVMLGTPGGIRVLAELGAEDGFAPGNVDEADYVSTPAAYPRPVLIDRTLVFTGLQQRRLYEIAYSREAGGYVPRELTLMAEHLFGGKVKEIHYQRTPTNTLWVVLEDGSCVAATYERDTQTFGVAQIVFPGTGVTVESMCVVPGNDYDVPMFVVGRTVNGTQQYRIERMQDPYRSGGKSALAYPHYLAAAAVYSGGATSTITGLSHLEGESVAVYDITNATDLGVATVASGQITVPGGGTVTNALVGLRMTSTLTTLRPPNVSNRGELLANPVRVVDIAVDVFETYGLEAGGDAYTTPLTTEEDHALSPAAPTLHDGSLEVDPEEGWNLRGEFTVSTSTAYPATIRAIQATLERGS